MKTLKADLQLIEPAYFVTAKLAVQVKLNAKTTPGAALEKGKDYKNASLLIQSLGRPRLEPIVGMIKQGLRSSK